MMKALEIAIEKLKALPEERQAYAAEVIEQIAASDDGVFQIPVDHLAAVQEGLAQAERASSQTAKKSTERSAAQGPEGSPRSARRCRP